MLNIPVPHFQRDISSSRPMMHPYDYDSEEDPQYDKCVCCENTKVSLVDRKYECCSCIEDGCGEAVCEDCREGAECSECQATVCYDCGNYCKFDLCPSGRFCSECCEDHEETCTPFSHATSKLEKISVSIADRKAEKISLKQRLSKITEELEDLKKQKVSAEKMVKQISIHGK